MKTYELYTPTIYIKDKLDSDERVPYKLVIARFKKMTFVYLMKNSEIEEFDYTLLYERSDNAAQSLVKKVDPILDFYSENYLKHDSMVMFFYYNRTNLAVKYSPSIKNQILTTDLRHLLNIINEKFKENEKLTEYQITSHKYWLIGVKSLDRLLVIMLPVSLSQYNADAEKDRIIEKYFSQFIMN